MQTSVIGFPRIGALRELKFASEKYFRKEITAKELSETAKTLRKTHWLVQKEAETDYISSNDFSYYDIMLDTAVMFGIVPKRYKELNLSELDTYFAMARGYQGASGDVKALAMKKWFNTNYHYIVPEVEDDTKIRLSGNKLWDEYAEAKELGIETKPVVIGAYTLLKLCRYTGEKTATDFEAAVVSAYQELMKKCEAQEIAWLQLDEAALREKLPLRKSDWYREYLDFAIPAFRLTHSGVKPETQIHTHMCYSEFTDIIPAIDDMDADVITFEASRSDLQILDSLREHHFETEVGPGVYDIHSPRVPSVEEIVEALNTMLSKIDRDKLWVNPDCGLKTRDVPETEASLKNMVEAARKVKENL